MFEIRDKISVPLLSADKFIDAKDVTILPHVLKSMSSEPLKEKCAGYNDPIFYIYTSGTTGWHIFFRYIWTPYPFLQSLFYIIGMPKAAIIKHSRYLFASYCLFCMGLTYDDDILYSVLPMYHSAAHVCLGVTITEGNTAVTRKKFSATKFWEDCVRNNVTVRIK